MKSVMIQEDIKLVEARLKQFELNTGCELLLVVASQSDPYPAAPWRFGVISGFLITLIFSNYYAFNDALLWPVTFFLVTLFMVWLGHFGWAKKLALSDWEVDRECEEKALELFHSLGTSKVSHKVTAMIMASVLEHRIEVLVDEKLKSKLSQNDLDELVKIMQRHFREGQMAAGFTQSMVALEDKILKDFGGKVSEVPPAELKDRIHFL